MRQAKAEHGGVVSELLLRRPKDQKMRRNTVVWVSDLRTNSRPASLDDANVGRFSELVREMSDKVQFLFVTHNKVTMEVAHQMLGVTMREPGISRLVSVDLEKAVAMAAS